MAQCLTPYRLKSGEDVPCGRCPACYKRRVSGWAFRLLEQNKWAHSAHFVTLTYDTKNVPISRSGRMTLRKSDLQKFFKRLRHALPGVRIKYYACGEYGSKTWRPHYHAIIFNATVDAIVQAWTLQGNLLGYVHTDDVNGATINYTLKYMCKTGRVPYYSGDDRLPEFSLMSKGLGSSYINTETIKYHQKIVDREGKLDVSRSRMYLVMPGGHKVAMPRYYKLKIFTDETIRAAISWVSGYKARKEEETHLGDAEHMRNFDQAIEAAFRSFDAGAKARQKI